MDKREAHNAIFDSKVKTIVISTGQKHNPTLLHPLKNVFIYNLFAGQF